MKKKSNYRDGKDQRYSDEAYARFREYQKDYNKERYRRFTLNLNTETEKDMIEYLKQNSKGFSEYVKALIKEDMKQHQK